MKKHTLRLTMGASGRFLAPNIHPSKCDARIAINSLTTAEWNELRRNVCGIVSQKKAR